MSIFLVLLLYDKTAPLLFFLSLKMRDGNLVEGSRKGGEGEGDEKVLYNMRHRLTLCCILYTATIILCYYGQIYFSLRKTDSQGNHCHFLRGKFFFFLQECTFIWEKVAVAIKLCWRDHLQLGEVEVVRVRVIKASDGQIH